MSHIKPTPFGVILEHLADKTAVGCVYATLSKLYERKQSKPEAEKQWSLQNGELTEIGTGVKIPVVFKDRDEIAKSWQGRHVFLESKQGEKGASGVYVFDDDYKPAQGSTFTRKIKVTATGIVSLEGGQGGPAHQAPAQNHPQTQQVTQRQQYREPQGQGNQGEGYRGNPTQQRQQEAPQGQQPPPNPLKAFRYSLGQIVTGWTLCHDAATAVAHGIHERHGQLTSGAAVGIMADKFFIEMARKGMLWTLPIGQPLQLLGKPLKPLSELTVLLGEAAVTAEVKKASAVHQATQPNTVLRDHADAAGQPTRRVPTQEQIHDAQSEGFGQQTPEKESYHNDMEDDDIPF